jgi:hypothetical protein
MRRLEIPIEGRRDSMERNEPSSEEWASTRGSARHGALLCENCVKSLSDWWERGSVLSESRCPRVDVSLWKEGR